MFNPSGLSTVRMLALASIIPFGSAGAADLGIVASETVLASVPPLAGLTLEAAERMLIVAALSETQNNVSEAARRLGVSRMTLRYRLEKYGRGSEIVD